MSLVVHLGKSLHHAGPQLQREGRSSSSAQLRASHEIKDLGVGETYTL